MLAFSLRAIPLKNGRGGVFVFEKNGICPFQNHFSEGRFPLFEHEKNPTPPHFLMD